jgi:hypothetical protein
MSRCKTESTARPYLVNSFDFGDSDGQLENSAAGYFMGYAALPSSR